MNEEELEAAFREAVGAYRRLPGEIPLPSAIAAMTGFQVLQIDQTKPDDAALIRSLSQAVGTCAKSLQNDPIFSGRVNEVGNLFEPRVKAACEAAGLKAEWPTDSEGRAARSGYPDLLIYDSKSRPTYLEVKTVGPGQDSTTFRSFYLSPSERPKICHDARHLLVAFAHVSGEVVRGKTAYRASAFKIVDLAVVIGGIKFEYQSSNKRLYLDECVLSSGFVEGV